MLLVLDLDSFDCLPLSFTSTELVKIDTVDQEAILKFKNVWI